MLPPGSFGAFEVVPHKVVDGRAWPGSIKRMSRIRKGKKKNASGPYHAQEILQGADWIFHVLQNVVCDHEVQRPIAELLKALGIVDHVDLRHQLRVNPDSLEQRALALDELGSAHPIDVAHPHPRRHAQRPGQGADLDSLPGEVSPREVLPKDPGVRSARPQQEIAEPQISPAAGDETPSPASAHAT